MRKPYYTSTVGGVKVGRWKTHKIGKVLHCDAQLWFYENWCWWPWGHWDLWRAVTHKAIFSGFSVIKALHSFNSPVLPMPWWQWLYIRLEQWCFQCHGKLGWDPQARAGLSPGIPWLRAETRGTGGAHSWPLPCISLAPATMAVWKHAQAALWQLLQCPVLLFYPFMTFSHFLCKISDFTGVQMTMPRLSTAHHLTHRQPG